MIRDIDSRFGFGGTLHFADVNNIFNLCRYEQAWNIMAGSVWCSVSTCANVYRHLFAFTKIKIDVLTVAVSIKCSDARISPGFKLLL